MRDLGEFLEAGSGDFFSWKVYTPAGDRDCLHHRYTACLLFLFFSLRRVPASCRCFLDLPALDGGKGLCNRAFGSHRNRVRGKEMNWSSSHPRR